MNKVVVKRKSMENGDISVELREKDKHLGLLLHNAGDVVVDFYHDDEKKKAICQEVIEINKGNRALYKALIGEFGSYIGFVSFDVYGANMTLLEGDGCYRIIFERKDTGGNVVHTMYNNTQENCSMIRFIQRLHSRKVPKYDGKEPKNVAKKIKK